MLNLEWKLTNINCKTKKEKINEQVKQQMNDCIKKCQIRKRMCKDLIDKQNICKFRKMQYKNK